jgi:predicted O-linked N-acetylglucosamine transferase (SPINDLY family)
LSLASAAELADARRAFERAIALAPDQVKPLALFASVLRQSGAPSAELAPVVRRVLELSPELVDARVQLACCLFDENNYDEAHVNLELALKVDPDNLTARWLRLQMPTTVVAAEETERDAFLQRWRDGIAWFEAIDWRDPKHARQADATITAGANFYLAYLGRPLVAEQIRNAAVLRQMALTAYADRGEIAIRPIASKRRKIAVFSSSLNAHSVSRVWSPALLALDTKRFELGTFYAGAGDDASTQRWRNGSAHFVSGTRPVTAWIDALRAFAPDVLVFPDIGMDRIVQAVASLRHAPVQVTTWGHPVTSGMTATIDYFLSADACEPADADAHYSEVLVRLPRLGCYLDLPDPVVVRPRDDDGCVRLLCTQSADKLHPRHDALFARILALAPNARIDVLCSTLTANVVDALTARLRAAFARHGVDFDGRCRVYPRLPVAEYYAFIEQADLCLDSLDFSGGVTSLDALWRDKPIVALPGTLMRGRQTSGMLALLGLDGLIAADSEHYVRLAATLAGDGAARAALSSRIASRKRDLFRDESVVVALADFLGSVQPPPAQPSSPAAGIR